MRSGFVDYRRGPKHVQEAFDGSPRKAGVHRENGIPRIPRPSQGINKALAGTEIECHHVRHGASVGDRPCGDVRRMSEW
jgi:hypothetical protein